MSQPKTIKHIGRIYKIDTENVIVKIQAQSACVSCKLSGVCGESNESEKEIEVNNIGYDFKIGDYVEVQITETMGNLAVFFGYLLPFLIVLATLIITNAMTGNQGLSGLISLASLIPYYLILSLFKSKIKKTFQFTLNKGI